MFRRLFRAVRHFLGATILVIGSVCLIEVVIGVRHASRVVENEASSFAALTMPSPVAFEVLRPLARLDTPHGLIETNSFGLRGPEPKLPKPLGVYRVLVLGDEAVLAPHLDASETLDRQLASILNGKTGLPVEVINAGQPNACPLTLSLLYRHRLAALRPDAVVLVMSASDVAEDVRYRSFLRTDADRNPIACPHPSLGGKEQAIDVWRNEFRLVDWAASAGIQHWLDRGSRVRTDMLCETRKAEWLVDPSGTWNAALQTSLEPLRQLKSDVESTRGQFVIAIAPDVSALDTTPPTLAPGWQVVAQYARENQITLLDPTQNFSLSQTPSQFFVEPGDQAHDTPRQCAVPLSADGQKLVAYTLAVELAALPGLNLSEGLNGPSTR